MTWVKSLFIREKRIYMRALIKLNILIAFFLVAGFQARSQETDAETARTFMEEADIILKELKVFTIARDYYEQAANLDPTLIRANYLAGELYLKTVNKERATKYFLRVYEQDPDYKFNLTYLIGRGYHYDYQFDKAIEFYNLYKEKLKKNAQYRGSDRTSMTEVDRNIFEAENGKRLYANPFPYSIVNVGSNINSEWWDYAPVVNADETVMVFTSRRQEGNLNENVFEDLFYYEDIFISKKKNGVWQPAENIGSVVNTKYHDSNLGFSPDGKTLYIYSDEGNGDIYYTNKLSEDTWSQPQPLSSNINSEGYTEKSVSISADGELLFFASNRPGGNGGFDIYLSRKNKKGEWGPSQNLGPIINTEYDEDGPFIHYDGKTLYFSSKGHDTMGGYDIFKSEYDSANQTWTKPENMGYPLNTPDDDIYFVMTKDGKRGYYASVREDAMGYNDIYMVTIAGADKDVEEKKIAEMKRREQEAKEKAEKDRQLEQVEIATEKQDTNIKLYPVTLMLRVEDAEKKAVMDAKIELKGANDNVIVPSKRLSAGLYQFTIDKDDEEEFLLSVEREGYMFQNMRIKIPAVSDKPQEIRKKADMRRLTTGFSTVLRNIYFEFDKATFAMNSYSELNKIERILNENPNIKVEISGHTDNIGPAEYNKRLSQRRANAVVEYLIGKGVDRRRLIAKGYGEEKPLASNDDEVMGRELNRRVEFKVTSN